MDQLIGTLVVVHPQLTNDPISRQGQIGIIAQADVQKDTITVGFGTHPLGRYSADALLVLKDKNELYKEIMSGVNGMDSETFKNLLSINMKQETPNYGQLSDALRIAISTPEILKLSMTSLEDRISRSNTIDMQAHSDLGR